MLSRGRKPGLAHSKINPGSPRGTEEEPLTSSRAEVTLGGALEGLPGSLSAEPGGLGGRAGGTVTGQRRLPGPQHPGEMPSSWCFWTFSSLLLLLGRSLAVLIGMHQDSVNGTVDQPVLLPISYRFDGAPVFPVSISWTFSNSPNVLITCTVANCSRGAGGAPSACFAKCFPHKTYHDRAQLFPQNGSLLLQELQLNDSGVYSVTFKLSYLTRNGTTRQSHQTRNVTLTVHEQRFTPDHPGAPDPLEQDHIRNCVIGICSSAPLLLLLLLFCCVRRRGAAQQQKRKITEQQQGSGVEESLPESPGGDMATVYASIGDNFEQALPEVVYASITSPDPPRLNTGPCHLLV